MDYEQYVDDQYSALKSIDSAALESFIDGLRAVRSRGGTIWVAGNGGSHASASHVVADFVKTATEFGAAPLKAVAVSEMVSLATAHSNDNSFGVALASIIEAMARPEDAVMIISVSGRSPNLVECQRIASTMNLTVFSLVGIRGTELAALSDFALVVDSDDYQTVENAHMSLVHWFVKALWT